MTLCRRTIAPAAALALLIAGALALAHAPAALADSTLSQTLAPGASLSTGSTVSSTDPVQLTVSAAAGGEFTIDEVTAPAPPTFKGSAPLAWFGPQFTVTVPDNEGALETQTVTVTILADPAVLPPAPTWGAGPDWRSAAEQQKLCASSFYSFCVTTQAKLANFCDFYTGTPTSGDCTDRNSRLGSTQLLPDGDVQVTMQMAIPPSGVTFASGYPSWSCGPGTVVVNAPTDGTGALEDLIAHGVYYADDCTWASTVSGTVSVDAVTARRLHLHANAIGHIDAAPGAGVIELTEAAKSALRRLHSALDIHVVLNAHGTQPNQTWSDTATVRVPG